MQQHKKQIFYLFILFSIFNISYAQKSVLNENDFGEKHYHTLFVNHSILSCGVPPNLEIYSSLDIEALLSISNAITPNQVPLETNWQDFHPPSFASVNFNSANFSNEKLTSLPSDVKRILYLCLTWNESERLKLFVIPDSALENIAKRLREERPWKNLNSATVQKLDHISQETLKEFVYTVLRANVFESVRGDLSNNKSLWFISWNWLTPNSGIYQ